MDLRAVLRASEVVKRHRKALALLHHLLQGEQEIREGKGIPDAKVDTYFRLRFEQLGV